MERDRNFTTTTAGDGAWGNSLDNRKGQLKSGYNARRASTINAGGS
jgi:hypothetical protein